MEQMAPKEKFAAESDKGCGRGKSGGMERKSKEHRKIVEK